MKKLQKIFTGLALALAISVSSIIPVSAAEIIDPGQEIEVEVAVSELADGITVLLQKDEDGILTCTPYNGDISDIPVTMETADGVLEWAVFHLGLKNWSGSTGDLYFTISADELMSKVSGNAYVKSTSVLFPESFYNDDFNKSLNGYKVGATMLKEDINLGSETKVKVGFKNVVLTCVNSEKGYFSNTATTVSK